MILVFPDLGGVEWAVARLLGDFCWPWHVVVGSARGGSVRVGYCVVVDDGNEYICSFSSEEPWDDFWAATRVVWSAGKILGGFGQVCLFDDVVDFLRFG